MESLDTEKNEILACRASTDEDTWFVTSIPMQKGMTLFVDGEKTDLVTVNTAFAGARLTAGEHEIRLCFDPPGMKAGFGSVCWLELCGSAFLSSSTFMQIKSGTKRCSGSSLFLQICQDERSFKHIRNSFL